MAPVDISYVPEGHLIIAQQFIAGLFSDAPGGAKIIVSLKKLHECRSF
jgi:hypothetical protein